MGLGRFFGCAVVVLVLLMSGCEKHQSQADIERAKLEVLQAAKDYSRLQRSDSLKAEETYWDMGELVKTVFGDDLEGYRAETQEKVRQQFRQMFRRINTVPEVQDVLRGVTMNDFQVEGPKDGKYIVSFMAEYEGKKKLNRLLFKRVNDKWKIVDSAGGPGERFMGERFKQFYEEERGKKSPLEFISEVVDHFDNTDWSERIKTQQAEAQARTERTARPYAQPRIEKAPVAEARPATETAVDAARRYTSLMKGAQPIKAVETFWEFPEMLEAMFGQRLAGASQAERDEMKKLLVDFFRTLYANPQIAEAMKRATFEDFASKEAQDGKTVVTFTAHIEDQKVPNVLVFRQIGGQWRIVDAAASNQPLMVETFAREYKKHAERMTPLEFLRLMTAP